MRFLFSKNAICKHVIFLKKILLIVSTNALLIISPNTQNTCSIPVYAHPTLNVPESVIQGDVDVLRTSSLGHLLTRLRHSVAFMFFGDLHN